MSNYQVAIFHHAVKLEKCPVPSWHKRNHFSTNTIVEDNVTIYHQVTCGRGDIFPKSDSLPVKGIILKKVVFYVQVQR